MQLKTSHVLATLSFLTLGACASHKQTPESAPLSGPVPAAAIAPLPTPAGKHFAMAQLSNAQGQDVGTVNFYSEAKVIHAVADLKNLPAGTHGFHVHQVGKCDAPDFKTAGEHLAVKGQKHGTETKGGPHEGDMPNLEVDASGTARVGFDLNHVKAGKKGSPLLGKKGSAVVVHAQADDNKSQPSGNSGDRIACGVVKAVQ